MTPQECWENYGRAFKEWGLIYDNCGWSGGFDNIAKRLDPMPEGFLQSLPGQCFRLPYPEGELNDFNGSGDSFGLRRSHKTNRISIKFYKENSEGKKIISKYQLMIHLRVIREDWKEDININPLDPQYIIGYVYPAIVRDFDFKDSYYHYIEDSYNR